MRPPVVTWRLLIAAAGLCWVEIQARQLQIELARLGGQVQVDHQVDWERQSVTIRVSPSFRIRDVHWFLIGFSAHGDVENADVCIFANGSISDGWIDSRGRLQQDAQQDCNVLRVDPKSGVFTIRRKFSTCDPRDYRIEQGTTHILVAAAEKRRNSVMPLNLRSPGVIHNFGYSQLVNDDTMEEEWGDMRHSDPAIRQLDVIANGAHVPPQETTYWCIVQRLSDEMRRNRHHIVAMEAIVARGSEHIVHHMEIFECVGVSNSADIQYDGNCNAPEKPKESRRCSKVIAAWAMGEGPVVYPPEAGLPVGGPSSSGFIMVEIHYNNPQRIAGIIDRSGFRFHHSNKLRKFDAGIMELGLVYSDANSIPPGQSAFQMTGWCTAECTKNLPNDGIRIFGSQLHAHLTGRRLWTSHYRSGVKMGEINRDNHYSPHWQHIQAVRPKQHLILPGDVLATTCVYDTRKRRNVTLGGYGIEDEMCVNYIYYYPASNIEVCKSAVNNASLHSFFYNNWNLARDLPISTKYQSIRWNQDEVSALKELFSTSPLNQHCLGHDGSPLKSRRSWQKIVQLRPRTGPFDKAPAEDECPSM